MTMRETLVWCWMEAIFSYCLARRDEDDACLRMLQQIHALLGDLRRVDGDVNCAQQQCGEVGDRPLRPVLAQDGDAIALANPPSLQLSCGSEDLGLQLGGGDWCPRARLARQHHAIAVAVHDREEDFVEGLDIHGFRVNATDRVRRRKLSEPEC